MKKIWSISTTLRNPERVRNFLIALKDFDGQTWGNETQKAFQINLIKYRFYGFGSTQFYSDLTQEQIKLIDDIKHQLTFEEAKDIFYQKKYEDPAMRGRTSFKPLEKMGVAFIVDKRVKITPLGDYLLSENYDLGELFFKSFLKWQYPNPSDRSFNNREIYNIKPFIATLHLIYEVNKICKERSIKEKGIAKVEFELFGQTLLHYKDIKQQANKIVDFRLKLEKIKNHLEKKEFIQNFIQEFLFEYVNLTEGNLKDYADNTIRYFRLTRFLYIRGGGFYIDLEPRRKIEIEKLLKSDIGKAEEFSKKEYLEYMSNISLPILPWENKEELEKIAKLIKEDIESLEKKLNISSGYENKNIDDLRAYRKKLQDIQLKNSLQAISKVDEVIKSLSNIRKLDLKPSIALEKYTTQALNIINDAIEIKANSLVGDDNEFIFTAPANKPDIECFYKEFNSICEVTMLTNRDQWHNEGQPVMRHFRDFEKISNKSDNYCLFVAPKMHRDTINTFWFSVKYEYEGKKQKIIPLTITQLIEILEVIKTLKSKNRFFTYKEFKKLLDDILNLKDTVSTSDEWLKAIPTILINFQKEYFE